MVSPAVDDNNILQPFLYDFDDIGKTGNIKNFLHLRLHVAEHQASLVRHHMFLKHEEVT